MLEERKEVKECSGTKSLDRLIRALELFFTIAHSVYARKEISPRFEKLRVTVSDVKNLSSGQK